MNFFALGFVLCGIDFNMGFPAVYIIRLLGLAAMFAGICECDALDRSMGFSRFSGMIYLSAALSAAALVCACLGRFGVIEKNISVPLCTVTGCLSFASVVWHQNAVTKHMLPLHLLVNDPSLLNALRKKWIFFAAAGSVSVAAEAVNRTAASGGNVHTFSGVILLISRLVMFGSLISVGTAFDRVRRDFNTMHPI